jgi:hypothetical protein
MKCKKPNKIVINTTSFIISDLPFKKLLYFQVIILYKNQTQKNIIKLLEVTQQVSYIY